MTRCGDTPYTLAVLKREFGTGIAAMVAEQTAIHRLRRRPGHKAAQVMATIRSADTRVVATMMADRLYNMQTIQFLPQARQLRQAREVLDTYLPAAQELSMPTVAEQRLQTLACAALISNQPLRPPPPPGFRRAGHRELHQPARSGEGRTPDHARRVVRRGAALSRESARAAATGSPTEAMACSP